MKISDMWGDAPGQPYGPQSGQFPNTGTEFDPHGKGSSDPGAKLDAGKLDMWLMVDGFSGPLSQLTKIHLLPLCEHINSDKALALEALAMWPLAFAEVAKVTNEGARKYTPNGWKKVPNGEARYLAAMCRHAADLTEVFDKDTGCRHMAQVIWNALAASHLASTSDSAAEYIGIAQHFLGLLEASLEEEQAQ